MSSSVSPCTCALCTLPTFFRSRIKRKMTKLHVFYLRLSISIVDTLFAGFYMYRLFVFIFQFIFLWTENVPSICGKYPARWSSEYTRPEIEYELSGVEGCKFESQRTHFFFSYSNSCRFVEKSCRFVAKIIMSVCGKNHFGLWEKS